MTMHNPGGEIVSSGTSISRRAFSFTASRLIGLLTLFILLALTTPGFLRGQNIINVLRQASLLTVLGCGMTLVIITGGIDLSVGAVATLSSCIAANRFLMGQSVLSVFLGIIIALSVGAFCGFINGLMVARVKLPPFIATFGMMQVARGCSLPLIGGNIIYGFRRDFRFLGAGVIGGIPVPIIVAASVVAAIWFVSRKTVLGRSTYATGANKRTAMLSGIDVDRTLIQVYVLNGMIAAFTGLLYIARLNAAEPGFGDQLQLQAIAATVMGGTVMGGGRGGVMGTVIGALIMTMIINGMNLNGISSLWQQALSGTIIIYAVLADILSQRRRSGGQN